MTSIDPLAVLRDRFSIAVSAAFPELQDVDPLLSPSKQAQFGDFQSNVAMSLGRQLGMKPREVAKAIVEKLDLGDLADPVTEESIAGPGFINVRLRGEALADLLATLDSPSLGVPVPESKETVVVDVCGVNLAKQMHVGHLRATVIGDAIARLFERLGHDVRRQNHVGDWGLPIAMVTRRLMDDAQSGTVDPDSLTLDRLEALYRDAQVACAPDRRGLAAVNRFDLGPKARAELEEQVAGAEAELARAKETLVKLQSHDSEVVSWWKRIADTTMRECLAMCARLDTKISEADSAGESSYAEELGPMVEDLERRGIAEESDGALVIRNEGIAEPTIIRKSEAGGGGFLYATTDIAAIRRRVQKLGGDRVIYAVDSRQSLHFKQVFASAVKAGYARKPGADHDSELIHAAFGTVLGPDNRPFKTRSGDNVKLSDLVDEAVERAARVVAEKSPDSSSEERNRIAEVTGVAAIKYADLSNDRLRDYVFDFNRMVAFEGNTGPYLLYAAVRPKSILRKAEERGIDVGPDAPWRSAPFRIVEGPEKTLALTLLSYPRTLMAAAESVEPHRICAYLFEVATSFSSFYDNDRCKVLVDDDATRSARLRLVDLSGRVLEDGLHVLGIRTLDRM